jgi:hypothetical protein
LSRINEWWGFNSKLGWVVLDKSLSAEFAPPGPQAREWLFFRCDDSSFFKVKDSQWRPPEFVAELEHLSSLSGEEKVVSRNQFELAKTKALSLRDTYIQQQIAAEEAAAPARAIARAKNAAEALAREVAAYERSIEEAEIKVQLRAKLLAELQLKRTAYFSRLGIPDPGTRAGRGIEHKRVTHCYACKGALDNSVDLECMTCGWMLCTCAACGCGYTYQRY